MTALLDCPAEVLHSIFEHLPASSLHALCLVSKHVHQVAEPLLYTEIELVWMEHRPPPIISLLQSIQRRPQLAHYVQSLTLRAPFRTHLLVGNVVENPDGFHYTHLPPSIPTEGSDLAGFIATIRDTDSPFSALWIQELESGTMDAFVTLLLSLTQNITRLRLTGVFARENRLLGMMLRDSLCRNSGGRLPQLQLLREVITEPQMNPYRRREPRNTADVLPLFYLPSVRSIAAEIDNPAIFAWPTYTPNSSHITTLDLKIVREGHLGRILATTKNLRMLKWEWGYEPSLRDEINNHVINLDQIAADLSLVQETLERLHLSATVEPEHHDDPILGINGSLKRLRNFEKLQTLQIPQLFLMGFSPVDNLGSLKDLLPKNIHHLTINDDISWLEEIAWQDRDLLDKLQQWWENHTDPTPCFHSFLLSLRHTDDQWCAGIRQELVDLGARRRIQLEIIKQREDLC
ncbi:hypothetical protein J3F83DRAFT_154855 [Trichoderma novae-zelandiae]